MVCIAVMTDIDCVEHHVGLDTPIQVVRAPREDLTSVAVGPFEAAVPSTWPSCDWARQLNNFLELDVRMRIPCEIPL